MSRGDATRIVAFLLGFYPDTAMEPQAIELFAQEVAILADAHVAMEAARLIVREAPRFPTLKEIRTTYRSVAERQASARAETLGLPEPEPGPRELPPEARDLLERLASHVEMPAQRRLTTLPATVEGRCDDCGADGDRVVYGTRAVCRRCALARLGAAAKIEAERLAAEQAAAATRRPTAEAAP